MTGEPHTTHGPPPSPAQPTPTDQRWGRHRRQVAALLVTLLIAAAGASRYNPLLAIGAENRLEQRCQGTNGIKNQSWTYDREAWTPLLWTCNAVTATNEHDMVRAFP